MEEPTTASRSGVSARSPTAANKDVAWLFNPSENPVSFRAGEFVMSFVDLAALPIGVAWLMLNRH
jgi:hypothetical protein